MGGVHIKNIQI